MFKFLKLDDKKLTVVMKLSVAVIFYSKFVETLSAEAVILSGFSFFICLLINGCLGVYEQRKMPTAKIIKPVFHIGFSILGVLCMFLIFIDYVIALQALG